MFFGNFKPRILTMQLIAKKLMMAYRYVPTRKIKREFELGLNDYAEILSAREFSVHTKNKKFVFRVGDQDLAG